MYEPKIGEIAVLNGARMRYVGGGRWVPAPLELPLAGDLLAKRFDPGESGPLLTRREP